MNKKFFYSKKSIYLCSVELIIRIRKEVVGEKQSRPKRDGRRFRYKDVSLSNNKSSQSGGFFYTQMISWSLDVLNGLDSDSLNTVVIISSQ